MNIENIENITLKQKLFFVAAMSDSLGVPFEFKSAKEIKEEFIDDPSLITIAYKTYRHIPVGYFSDDFSQILCVEESLKHNLYFNDEIIEWAKGKYWTDENVFDMGVQTIRSLQHYQKTNEYLDSGKSSGNGGLMRMLPVALYFDKDQINQYVEAFMYITHNSAESIKVSQFYCHLVKNLLQHGMGCGYEKFRKAWSDAEVDAGYGVVFGEKDRVFGAGYCLDSIEIMKDAITLNRSFNDCIKYSIKLGHDTDTNTSILAPVAALVYGMHDINPKWLDMMAVNEGNKYYMKAIHG